MRHAAAIYSVIITNYQYKQYTDTSQYKQYTDKYEYIKLPFGLTQAPAYFQELMTGILKDFNFAIGYLDDIIIFSRTAEEHLGHIKHVFEKLISMHLSMKLSKCPFSPRKFST